MSTNVKRYQSRSDILIKNRILIVSKLYTVEIVRKCFEQIGTEASVKYFEQITNFRNKPLLAMDPKVFFCSLYKTLTKANL